MHITHELSIRRTHRYVGTYKHLDEHEPIGGFTIIGSEELPKSEDDLDDLHILHYVVVFPDGPGISDEDIRRALHDEFSSHDCAHVYDCCGCRSYYVETAERWTGDLWKVQVSSSRNY